MNPSLLKDFDIQADGGDGFDWLAVGQGVKEGGFTGVFEADYHHVEFFGEEYIEEFAEDVSHGCFFDLIFAKWIIYWSGAREMYVTSFICFMNLSVRLRQRLIGVLRYYVLTAEFSSAVGRHSNR